MKSVSAIAPEYSNTGARNTYIEVKSKKTFSVDWFQGSIHDGIKYDNQNKITLNSVPFINKLIDILIPGKSFFDYEIEYRGNNGYRERMSLAEGVTLYFNGSVNKFNRVTSMLELTGTGCDVIKTEYDWFALLNLLLDVDVGFHATRIDLATDDYYGEEMTYMDVFEYVKKGLYVRVGTPRTDPFGYVKDWNKFHIGSTLYFYSNSSDVQLRIYDKMYEQKTKNNYLTSTPQWVRYEMVFKHEQAEKTVREFYTMLLNKYVLKDESYTMQKYVSSKLYYLVKFKKPSSDTNKSRWPDDEKYLNFLGSFDEMSIERLQTKKCELCHTKEYLDENYMKVFAKIYLATDFDFFISWIKQGMYYARDKFKQIDIIEVNNLRKQLDLNELNLTDIDLKMMKLNPTKDEYKKVSSLWKI